MASETVYVLEAQGYVFANGKEESRVPNLNLEAVDFVIDKDKLYLLEAHGYVYVNGAELTENAIQETVKTVALTIHNNALVVLASSGFVYVNGQRNDSLAPPFAIRAVDLVATTDSSKELQVYILDWTGVVYKNGAELKEVEPSTVISAQSLEVIGNDVFVLDNQGRIFKNGQVWKEVTTATASKDFVLQKNNNDITWYVLDTEGNVYKNGAKINSGLSSPVEALKLFVQ